MNTGIPFIYPFNNQLQNNNQSELDRINNKLERLEKNIRILENRLNKLENKSNKSDYLDDNPKDMYII